ncbi:MAG: sugar phosphate isomerase/epimerase [Bacteroidales bacterium]
MKHITRILPALLAMLTLFASCKTQGNKETTEAPETTDQTKHIGLAIYSVKGIEGDLDRAFQTIADIGYKTIEIAHFRDGKIFDKSPAEFKAYLEGYGLTVTSSHTRALIDPADVEASLAAWGTLLDAHKEMGCKYVVLPMHQWGADLETVKANCALFDKIGELAHEKGVKLGYHSHNGEFSTIPGTDIMYEDYLIENTNPENIFFEVDVYWAYQGGQDPTAWLQKYPERISVLHIKDYYVIGASGKIDYKPIFDQFYANGHQDFFVEMENDMGMEVADKVAKIAFESQRDPQPFPEEIMKLFLEGDSLDKALEGIAASYKYLAEAEFVH